MRRLSKEAFGKTPATFEAAVAKALRREEEPVKRMRITKTLVLVMIFLLLACTALAVTINQSARHQAARSARDAVMETYGLTTETMGLLYERTEPAPDGYTVEFSPVKYTDQVGVYTAHVTKDGVAVAWTHDGVNLDACDLSSPAWGQQQLLDVLALEQRYRDDVQANRKTPEEQAELTYVQLAAERDRVLAEARAKGVQVGVISVAPGEDDLSEQEAIEAARAAIIEKYGVDETTLDEHALHVSLYLYDGEDEATYRVEFTQRTPDDAWSMDSWFSVSLKAHSGKLLHYAWQTEPENRTLPAGPLDDYRDAVGEYMEEGAFDLRTPEEKAELAGRIEAAGLGSLLPYRGIVMPGTDDLPEAEALTGANAALQDAYGFAENTLALFATSTTLVESDGARNWIVAYAPALDASVEWLFAERMGAYTARIDAVTGEALQTSWSLADKRGSAAYTAATFGTADAWDAAMLPWVLDLMEGQLALNKKYEAIEAETYPVMADWSLEDLAARDGMMRDAGFDAAMFYNGMPRKDDLTEAEAIEIARTVAVEEFDASPARMEAALITAIYSVANPEQPSWGIRLFPADSAVEEYTVIMDAASGEILFTDYTASGNG